MLSSSILFCNWNGLWCVSVFCICVWVLPLVSMRLICGAVWLMTPGVSVSIGGQPFRVILSWSSVSGIQWAQTLRWSPSPWLLSHLYISLSATGIFTLAEIGEFSFQTRTHSVTEKRCSQFAHKHYAENVWKAKAQVARLDLLHFHVSNVMNFLIYVYIYTLHKIIAGIKT